jgi:hypothetical protein
MVDGYDAGMFRIWAVYICAVNVPHLSSACGVPLKVYFDSGVSQTFCKSLTTFGYTAVACHLAAT